MATKALPPRTPHRVIRNQLVAECAVRGYTQEQLANLAGVAKATVNTDWQNPGKITLDRLLRYMTALGIQSLTVESR